MKPTHPEEQEEGASQKIQAEEKAYLAGLEMR